MFQWNENQRDYVRDYRVLLEYKKEIEFMNKKKYMNE